MLRKLAEISGCVVVLFVFIIVLEVLSEQRNKTDRQKKIALKIEKMAKVRIGFLYVYNKYILLQQKPDEYYLGMELNLSLHTRYDYNGFISIISDRDLRTEEKK